MKWRVMRQIGYGMIARPADPLYIYFEEASWIYRIYTTYVRDWRWEKIQ